MYIVNAENYYFRIHSDDIGRAIIDPAKLSDCKLFQSAQEMYAYICMTSGLSVEDVEDTEIGIRQCSDGYEETDFRGQWFDITLEDNQSLEHYLSNFVI